MTTVNKMIMNNTKLETNYDDTAAKRKSQARAKLWWFIRDYTVLLAIM